MSLASALLRLSLFGVVAAGSCGGCRDTIMVVCGGGAALIANDNEAEKEESQLLAKCGTCASGTTCNLVTSPPRCTPSPGPEGAPCGTWFASKGGRSRDYLCDGALVCNHGFQEPTCSKRMGPGGICWLSSDCFDELWCHSENHTCVSAPDGG